VSPAFVPLRRPQSSGTLTGCCAVTALAAAGFTFIALFMLVSLLSSRSEAQAMDAAPRCSSADSAAALQRSLDCVASMPARITGGHVVTHQATCSPRATSCPAPTTEDVIDFEVGDAVAHATVGRTDYATLSVPADAELTVWHQTIEDITIDGAAHPTLADPHATASTSGSALGGTGTIAGVLWVVVVVLLVLRRRQTA
jgi:hypothetical protein